jgi:hypothetical protein
LWELARASVRRSLRFLSLVLMVLVPVTEDKGAPLSTPQLEMAQRDLYKQ